MRRTLCTIAALLGAGYFALTAGAAGRAQFQPAEPLDAAIPRDLLRTLQSHGIAATPTGLVLGLRSPSWSARIAALVALGRIGKFEQLSPVMALAETRSSDATGKEVRRNAILAAARIAQRSGGLSLNTRSRLLFSARDILAEAKTPLARLEGAEVLGQLGDASQYAIVVESLKAPSLVSRALTAVRLYAKLPGAAYGGQKVNWASAVGEVLQSKASRPVDRTNAVIALADIGTAEALAVLRNALPGETDPDVKGLIVYTLRYAADRARGIPPRRTPIGTGRPPNM
ncbi:MAG TPA: hypothetical protein VGM51_01250 [Armatimonadota bacterium]|jgi:hypothetical protein